MRGLSGGGQICISDNVVVKVITALGSSSRREHLLLYLLSIRNCRVIVNYACRRHHSRLLNQIGS